MNLYLIPIFEEVFEEFLCGTGSTDFSLYRHSSESAPDLLQDFYSWFYTDSNNYISGIKEIINEGLNPREEGVEVLEELTKVLTYDKKTGLIQGEIVDFNPLDTLNSKYKIEYGRDLELFTGETKKIVVSICIGEFVRVKVDGQLSLGFYHQSRFQSKRKKMLELTIFHPVLAKSLLEKELHGFKSQKLPEVENFFVGERVWMKNDCFQEWQVESISSISSIENKRYVIAKVDSSWVAGVYKEKIDTYTVKTVFAHEISSFKSAKDVLGLTLNVGTRVTIKVTPNLFHHFADINGWDTKLTNDNLILNQYRYLLELLRFDVVDFKKFNLSDDNFYIYAKIFVTELDKELFEKLKLKDNIFKIPSSYCTRVNMYDTYDYSHNTENEVSKKRRLEEERIKSEKDNADKDFDRQHGPYTGLSEKFIGKLILIDWPTAEIDCMSGVVSEVNEDLGRVSITLENSKTYFFRESINQLEKHIKIVSDIVISSEENPELV